MAGSSLAGCYDRSQALDNNDHLLSSEQIWFQFDCAWATKFSAPERAILLALKFQPVLFRYSAYSVQRQEAVLL